MNSKTILRIASGLMFFHLAGHSYGHFNWRKANSVVQQEVIHQMSAHSFPFMGTDRSMSDYYEGYGYITSIALLFFGILLWLLSNTVKVKTIPIGQLLVATAVILFLLCIIEFVFFFPFAACTTLLAGILTVYSTFKTRSLEA